MEEFCACDKVGFVDWDRVLSDNPSPVTEKDRASYCICNQNCYVPRPCSICGPNGCANSCNRTEAQAMMAEAMNEALVKAGGKGIEVVPEDIMGGVNVPIRTRRRS